MRDRQADDENNKSRGKWRHIGVRHSIQETW